MGTEPGVLAFLAGLYMYIDPLPTAVVGLIVMWHCAVSHTVEIKNGKNGQKGAEH